MSNARTSQLKPSAHKIYEGGLAGDESKLVLPQNTTANLAQITNQEGSLAYDTDLQQVVVNTGAGFEPAGGGGTGTVTSVGTGTGLTGGPITTSGSIALANTAVAAGSYTLADITVDAQGRLTSAANGSAVTSVATGVGLTGGPITSTGTIDLADTAVTPGSYTAADITVDAQGRITAAASSVSSGANTNLSNLASPTAINQNLIFDGTLSDTFAINYGGLYSGGSAAFEITTDNYGNQNRNSPSINIHTGFVTNSGGQQHGSGDINIYTGTASGGAFAPKAGDVILQPGAGSTPGFVTFRNSAEGTVGHVWTSINTVGGGVWLPPSPTVYNSDPSAGGASSEALVVTGLLATDTIVSVSQRVAGANSLPLLGWTTVADDALTVQWSADPGAGAIIVVAVRR